MSVVALVVAFATQSWVLLVAAAGITAVARGRRPTRTIGEGRRLMLWVTLLIAAGALSVGGATSHYLPVASAAAVLVVALVGHAFVCGYTLGQVARVMRPRASLWGSLLVCALAALGLAGLVTWQGLLILPMVALSLGFCGVVLLVSRACSSPWLPATVVAGALGCLLIDLLLLERAEWMHWPRALAGVILPGLATLLVVRIRSQPGSQGTRVDGNGARVLQQGSAGMRH